MCGPAPPEPDIRELTGTARLDMHRYTPSDMRACMLVCTRARVPWSGCHSQHAQRQASPKHTASLANAEITEHHIKQLLNPDPAENGSQVLQSKPAVLCAQHHIATHYLQNHTRVTENYSHSGNGRTSTARRCSQHFCRTSLIIAHAKSSDKLLKHTCRWVRWRA